MTKKTQIKKKEEERKKLYNFQMFSDFCIFGITETVIEFLDFWVVSLNRKRFNKKKYVFFFLIQISKKESFFDS